MKKIIFSFLIFLPLQIVSGQDKIITIQNDTILCRIVSVSSTHIQYEQKDENQNIVGKFIPTEEVLEYFRSAQSSEIASNYQTYMPKPKKHYLGFSIAKGVGRYIGEGSASTWDEDFLGIGFGYSYRRGESEMGTGLIFSTATSISVPFTVKKYFGNYVFLGINFLAGFDLNSNYPLKESLCFGMNMILGAEYVFENGFSLSLGPNLQHSIIGSTRKDSGVPDIMQFVGFTIGIGYRF